MAGRKKIQLDTKQAEIFGYFKATYETMADYLGVSIDTIRDRMQEGNEFSNAYKKGFSGMKMKLSEAQLQTALKGNATLLIWLGKQYLGQKDSFEDNTKEHKPIKIEIIESNTNTE